MNLRSTFFEEVAELDLPPAPAPGAVVTDDEVLALPEPAQRYLRFMGVVGRPRDRSFLMHVAGRFRMKRHGAWNRCEIWQYDSAADVGRVFYMRLRVAGVFPVIARDTYLDGRGRMLGKLFDRLTVVDSRGEELDVGELATYLNDLVLFAPSMLLVPHVSWDEAGENAFDLTLLDRGHVVGARVFVAGDGAPLDFETTDRFLQAPADSRRFVRTKWTTPVDGFQPANGRKLPTRARAVWHPPEGSFAYAEIEVDPAQVWFNVPPAG